MKKIYPPIIASAIVATFGIFLHYSTVSPHDFGAVLMWLPAYISPIWGASLYSHISERGKE